MGLDMYALKTREEIIGEVDFNIEDAEKIHSWRKHPDLHGWMARLYYEKGGKGEHFNCDCVLLTDSDLDSLEAAILGNALPGTAGFFFGESDGSEKEDDLDFVRKAREAIKDGYKVFYDSWW